MFYEVNQRSTSDKPPDNDPIFRKQVVPSLIYDGN